MQTFCFTFYTFPSNVFIIFLFIYSLSLGSGGPNHHRHHRSHHGRHHRHRHDPFDDDFFVFKDPQQLFREFFSSDPFFDMLGGHSSHNNSSRHHHHNHHNQQRHHHHHHHHHLHPDPFNPFGSLGLFNGLGHGFATPGFSFFANMAADPFAACTASSFTTFSSSSSSSLSNPALAGASNGVGAGIKRTTTSTRFDETGKKIETRKVVENGIETVTIHENGRLVSRTVNGVSQALQMA